MVILSRIRIPDHFPTSVTIAELCILGLALLIQSLANFHYRLLGEMTNADIVMNTQHFGSDPTNIRLRIRSNAEIWIQSNSGSLLVEVTVLAEVCGVRVISSSAVLELGLLSIWCGGGNVTAHHYKHIITSGLFRRQ